MRRTQTPPNLARGGFAFRYGRQKAWSDGFRRPGNWRLPLMRYHPLLDIGIYEKAGRMTITDPMNEGSLLRGAGYLASRDGLPLDPNQPQDWQDGWQSSAGYRAARDGLPLDPSQPQIWQDGWHNFTGGQACRDGLPLDPSQPQDWQNGWLTEVRGAWFLASREGPPLDANQPRDWQGSAGYRAARDGLPLDPSQPQDWQIGWQMEAGGRACRDGLPLDPSQPQDWQIGWLMEEGGRACRNGLPLDPDQPSHWQTGWNISLVHQVASGPLIAAARWLEDGYTSRTISSFFEISDRGARPGNDAQTD